ncbi:hypothetical protein PIB30_077944 [Stylosanthes scabra]|uniref:Uncharacterized protein n=1 Tax=Stylosanthes scabra TaxID=79078 RepID=A0ABU6XNN5_9FABA|nr:hypothetical protein [Stylosanthes scabra]
MEKLEQSMVLQQKDMTEMKRQLKEWTRKASARDAYCCWAHQQANPNLTELPIHQIPEPMHLNTEKGRHLFHGGLKSHLVAGSSSQAALHKLHHPTLLMSLWLTPKIRHKRYGLSLLRSKVKHVVSESRPAHVCTELKHGARDGEAGRIECALTSLRWLGDA